MACAKSPHAQSSGRHDPRQWQGEREPSPAFALDRLRRFDGFIIQNNTHFASKQLEQNGDALAAVHAFIETKTVTKRPANHANLIARETVVDDQAEQVRWRPREVLMHQ